MLLNAAQEEFHKAVMVRVDGQSSILKKANTFGRARK